MLAIRNICAILSLHVVAGSYPVDLPGVAVTNLQEVYESLPPNGGDFSFDTATDPGGYMTEMNKNWEGWAEHFPNFSIGAYTDAWAWLLMVGYAAGFTRLPDDITNCSTNGFYEAVDFYGILNEQKICEPPDCCQGSFHGVNPYITAAENNHQMWSTRLSNGMCPDVDEPNYCWMACNENFVCIERYIALTERAWYAACADNMFIVFTQCPVYASSGVGEIIEMTDSPIYINSLTAEQSMAILVLFNWGSGDKICYPYSYYYPDAEGSEAGEETEETEETDEDDSSLSFPSALVFFVTSFVYLGAARV